MFSGCSFLMLVLPCKLFDIMRHKNVRAETSETTAVGKVVIYDMGDIEVQQGRKKRVGGFGSDLGQGSIHSPMKRSLIGSHLSINEDFDPIISNRNCDVVVIGSP